MFMLHIALQGCLKAGSIDYGMTPDTGGHIRYVLELCAANEKAGVGKQLIVTRKFRDDKLGAVFDTETESITERTGILRVPGRSRAYLPKEELWRETDAIADNLIAAIESWDLRPEVVHAHYADAGIVALALKRRLGIPFVFTGHSLGRVKAQAFEGRDMGASLRRRIEREETVIAAADRVVTSSRDEAEHQYALYPPHRPERITLNPPGCELDAFSGPLDPAQDERITGLVDRFLDDPAKAPVLALARPVEKKNLEALLHAFGTSRKLRTRANLVIFAGVREDFRDLDPEGRDVVERLLHLVDRYDLYGSVALPKTHQADQVPHIYGWAAKRGGLFANPALNEPFGLTILEAAASGLPVVATRNGGPVDIIGQMRNGRLIDPRSPQDLANASIDLLDSAEAWRQARDNGLKGVRHYSWARHALEYRADLEGLLRPRNPKLATTVQRPNLIVSDIDDTLVGEKESLAAFAQWRADNLGFHFAIATGRSLQDAIRVLREWDAPLPEILITSVGSEIYYSRDLDLRHLEADDAWSDHISEEWHRDVVAEVLTRVPGLRPQAPCEQRRHKISYFVDDKTAVAQAGRRLKEAGLRATVIHSHTDYLDILPKRGSKGQALEWVARKIGVPLSATIAAGDSGNDTDLLMTAGTGVIVGNHRPELRCLRSHPGAYFAKRSYAGGILEALARGVR